MMDIDPVEENSCLMDLMQEDLHLTRGLVQKDLIRMANKPDRMVVQFRDLNAKKKVFWLELGEQDPYSAVLGRISKKLHVDPLRIRLTRHNCFINDGPCSYHVKPGGCLLDIVWTGRFDKICNVIYYEVLNGEHLKTLKVSYKYPYEEMSVVLPKHARVEDLLNDIKKMVKLTNSNAELRLLGIYNGIHTVFPLDEKIKNMPEYVKLQLVERPNQCNAQSNTSSTTPDYIPPKQTKSSSSSSSTSTKRNHFCANALRVYVFSLIFLLLWNGVTKHHTVTQRLITLQPKGNSILISLSLMLIYIPVGISTKDDEAAAAPISFTASITLVAHVPTLGKTLKHLGKTTSHNSNPNVSKTASARRTLAALTTDSLWTAITKELYIDTCATIPRDTDKDWHLDYC